MIEPYEELSNQKSKRSPSTRTKRALVLIRNLPYVALVLGYACQTFVVGGFALYGPTYVTKFLATRSVMLLCSVGLLWPPDWAAPPPGGITLDYIRRNAASHSQRSLCVFTLLVFSVLALPAALPGVLCFHRRSASLSLCFRRNISCSLKVSPINQRTSVALVDLEFSVRLPCVSVWW